MKKDRAWADRESGLESLGSEELTRLRSWGNARVRRLQAQYFQYLSGFADRETYEGTLEFASRLQSFWKKLGGVVVPDAGFQAEIDEAVLTVEQIDVSEVDS